MITPSSVVKFLNVPFSTSQDNVLKFSNINSQITYMESKEVYTLNGCTYIREGDGEYLRVNKVMDSLYNCNYVMFQNTQFGDKWFYAFIEKLKYKNGNVTDVLLKIDSYQTFQFEHSIQDTFIERQTQSVDYYNTLADTPSTGDLKSVWQYEKTLDGIFVILFNSDPTKDDTSTSDNSFGLIGNYSTSCYMALCTTASKMSDIVQAVSNKGRADRIQACYFAPCFIGLTGYELQAMPRGDLKMADEYIFLVHNLPLSLLTETLTLNIPYTPVFKKEISYPYAKLEIVDRITGRHIELDLSKFANPLQPQFKLLFNITNSVEYKIIPLNYNGIDYSIENSLIIEPSSEMPLFSNAYAKYRKDNMGANLLTGVMATAGAVGSIMTGNVAGAVSSFGSIASTINADSVARKQPNQMSGTKGDAFEYLNYSPSIYFRLKVMDNDHMKIARNFWSAYGYPERRISTFNNTSNKFNFIKTVGANLLADTIPNEYQKDLETMYDTGVTIWNNNYLDYTIL